VSKCYSNIGFVAARGRTIRTTDADSPSSVKYVVRAVVVSIVAKRVQYYGKDGKLITEFLRDYTKGAVQEHYAGRSGGGDPH
jgi:type I restriction enzyme R subunit